MRFTFLAAVVSVLACSSPPASQQSTATAAAVPAEPDEPCNVEAPAAVREAAQNWCEGGMFTRVAVSKDANNFVVLLQLSKKGQQGYQGNKFGILNRLRGITDQMVERSDMNVAFSLHNTEGQAVGGCARRRGAPESTCN